MSVPSKFRLLATVFALALCATTLLTPVIRSIQGATPNTSKAAEPWPTEQVLHALDFSREISVAKGSDSPTVIYVGFRTLFEGGHIPGASFLGTASKEDGLAELRKSVAGLPRTANVVVYCGCCPFEKCPNIRPAYKTLHEMGFTRVRVLVLPTSFAADWVEKGYPMQKGL